MKINWERYLPLGMSFQVQGMTLRIGLMVSFAYSLRFFDAYLEQYRLLFSEEGHLKSDAVIERFLPMLGSALNGFYMLAAVMLLFAFWNWNYFYQESKSIYLMKRIHKRELYIRILTLPVLTSAAVLGLTGILMLIYRGIYYGLTPETCIR